MSHLRRIVALVFCTIVGVAALAGPAGAATTGSSPVNAVVNVAAAAADRCC